MGSKETVKISNIFFITRCNATVVQFGLGHQIANLVTRVQIPAVANRFFRRQVTYLSCLLFPLSDCKHFRHYLSAEVELQACYLEKNFENHWELSQLTPYLLKLQKIQAFYSHKKGNFHQSHDQGKSSIHRQIRVSNHEINPKAHQRQVFCPQPFLLFRH